jgi:AcrR family transcriptional regulator
MTERVSKRRHTAPSNVKPAVTASKTPPTRSRDRYEERRAQVVDIAAHVFAERGYHATTIDDLVEATGLQRGGLYHYITSKQGLLIAIHERFIEPLLENAREIAQRQEPPEVELRLLARALVQDIASYRDQVTVFLHEWRLIQNEPEWKNIREARKEFEDIVGSCLRTGKQMGTFRDVEEGSTLRAFLGMINYMYQWLNPRGPASPNDLADQFVDIFLHGILKQP